MARRARKQRITLRFKRREQLKHHVRSLVGRSVALALVIGFGAGLVTGGDSFLARFLQRHTPQIAVTAPQILSSLPILSDLPRSRAWMWLPGSGVWLQKRVKREYTAVRSVWLEREFSTNRIVIHLEPRLPLVSWNGLGFDSEGVLFAIAPGTWKTLPQASLLAQTNKLEMGRWLAHLSMLSELWTQVTGIKQNASEGLELTLKSGTLVNWGKPEPETLARKAQTLVRVLDDAHNNMGGAARADLRFFDQGRIIVLPKGK